MNFGAKARPTALMAAAVTVFMGLGLAGCDDRLERYRNPDVQIARGATWAWKPAPTETARERTDRKVLSRDEIRGDRDRDDRRRDRDDRDSADRDDRRRDRDDRDRADRDRDDRRGDIRSDRDRGDRRESPEMLAENEKVRGKIRVAIEKELNRKGLKQVDDPLKADFLVDYRAGIHRENVPVQRVYGGGYPGLVCGPFGCWESWGYGPAYVSYENVQIREGTIVLRFIQRGSGEVAYHALGEHRANREYFEQRHIDEAVQRLLKDLKPGQYEEKHGDHHRHHRDHDDHDD
jgi:hypothetical protein